MMTDIIKYGPQIWFRCSRGHRLSFFSSNDELAGFFKDLPESVGSCVFRMARWMSAGGSYERSSTRSSTLVPCWMSIGDWREQVACNQLLRINSFIHPDRLCAHPNESSNTGILIGRWCSTNGMICVQGFDLPDGRAEGKSISVVSLVENKLTGERHRHGRQLDLFNLLKNRIQMKLTHVSRPIYRDGSVGEEDRSVRMTDAAVELAQAGQIAAVPGQRLKKSR